MLPRMSKHYLAVVIGAVHYTLLLIFLKYPRNDRLCNNSDTAIIHHNCADCV